MEERPYDGTATAAGPAGSGGPGTADMAGRADTAGRAADRGAPVDTPHGSPGPQHDDPALSEAGIDLLGMDLESLRTVEHPVLSALVNDLRERIAAPGSEALWGFDNDSAPSNPPRW